MFRQKRKITRIRCINPHPNQGTGNHGLEVNVKSNGGCFETSKATIHAEPACTIDGVGDDCVANMPGSIAPTAAIGLTAATLLHGLVLANKGN